MSVSSDSLNLNCITVCNIYNKNNSSCLILTKISLKPFSFCNIFLTVFSLLKILKSIFAKGCLFLYSSPGLVSSLLLMSSITSLSESLCICNVSKIFIKCMQYVLTCRCHSFLVLLCIEYFYYCSIGIYQKLIEFRKE